MIIISLKQGCETDYQSLPALTVASLISEDRSSLPDNYRCSSSQYCGADLSAHMPIYWQIWCNLLPTAEIVKQNSEQCTEF